MPSAWVASLLEVDDEVGAAAVGEVADRVDHAVGGQHLVRAELVCEGAPLHVRVHADDGARAELAQELKRDVAHTAHAEQHDGAPGSARCLTFFTAWYAVRPASACGAGHGVHARRQLDHGALRHHQPLGEAAVHRQPRELVAVAVHVAPAPAGNAEPAAVWRVDDHGVAGDHRRDEVSDRLDDACVLVPEHERGAPAGSISPSMAWRSVAQTPAPAIRSSSSSGRAISGSGRSTSSSGRLYSLWRRPHAAALSTAARSRQRRARRRPRASG